MVGIDPKENKDNAFFFGGGGCGEGKRRLELIGALHIINDTG